MTDAFAALDERIAAAEETVRGCRRAIAASRAAVLAGVAVLLLALLGVGSMRTPTIVLAALAGAIGGTVWLGASTSSLREAETERAALDGERERLIDEVATRNGWRDLTPTVH